jgi:uncharacterized OB-fold protein
MNAIHPEPYARPVPEPTKESVPYWEGLRAHQLKVQKCKGCGALRHYPRPVCPKCWSLDVEWTTLSGRGRVHSWTVCAHPFHPGFKDAVPYIAVTVDLEEGVRLQAPLRSLNAAALRLGLPVVVGYDDVTPTLTLPHVAPA